MLSRSSVLHSLLLILVLGVISCSPASLSELKNNPLYVYENGAIHIGGDGEPVELINNPNADNPTFLDLLEFIKKDATDEHYYNDNLGENSYVCSDFAEDVHNNAERVGIKAAWVAVNFVDDYEGHALNAFVTTDKGLEYVKNVRFKSQVFSQQVHAGAVLREPQQGQPDEHSPI